jgi:transcriptional regulator with XRE-family HTH domain
MSNQARVGSTLRRIRRERNLTLAQLSDRTKVPVSSLSKIEKDQTSPTYDQLTRLTEGLGIDMADLFSASHPNRPVGAARRSINRLGEGDIFETPHHVLWYLSNDLIDKQFTPMLSEVKARSIEDVGEFQHHPGQEFVFVIDGELELHTEVYAPVRLQAGESIYFDSDMGHAYVAHGKGRCLILSICTAPMPSEKLPSQPHGRRNDEAPEVVSRLHEARNAQSEARAKISKAAAGRGTAAAKRSSSGKGS